MKFAVFCCLLSTSLFAKKEHTLINGRIANLADFPASVWVKLEGGLCSGTVVGERVVFIAAHCVKNSPTIKFSVGPNDYKGDCALSRDYSQGNRTADYALCVTDKVVTGIAYEKINIVDSRFKEGDPLLLTGFGCTELEGETGGNDGTYRIGEAYVERLPSGTDNDIHANNGAALCPGDSGGPAFYLDALTGDRFVTSANSRVDTTLRSYLPGTYTANALRFFKAWSEKFNQKFCGYDNDAKGCRGATKVAGNDSFTLFHRLVTLQAKLTPGNENRLEEIKNVINESFVWLQ